MAKMTGQKKFMALLRKIPPAIRADVKKAQEINGRELVAAIKNNAPVDEGDLRASIEYRIGGYKKAGRDRGFNSRINDPSMTLGVKAGGRKAPYAPFVEHGTVKMDARAFFYPTYRGLRKRLKGRITRAATKGIKRVAGSAAK